MAEALDIHFDTTPDPVLKEARTARNKASGQPTKRNRQLPVTHYFLSRASLTQRSFTLLGTTADGLDRMQEVDLLDLIARHQHAIATLLAGIGDELEQREEAHRRAFMDQRLTDAFDSMTDYYLEKIGEGLRRPSFIDQSAEPHVPFEELIGGVSHRESSLEPLLIVKREQPIIVDRVVGVVHGAMSSLERLPTLFSKRRSALGFPQGVPG